MSTKSFSIWNLERAVLFRIIAILAGAVYVALHAAHFFSLEFNSGLSVAIMLFLIEQFIELQYKLNEKEGQVARFNPASSGLLGSFLRETKEKLALSLKEDNHQFIVDNEILAIDSYADFWHTLVLSQEKRGAESSIWIRAVHSCNIKVWLEHPLAKRLLNSHSHFTEAKGRVTRIICGEGPPSAEALEVFEVMRKHGVSVYYYNIKENAVNHTFTWDFVLVGDSGEAVIWDSFGGNLTVAKAVYCASPVYQQKDLRTLWEDILRNSKPADHFFAQKLTSTSS